MSRVPYTIHVDEFVCTELERMRTMCKTLDFSGLPASIERVQYHATSMENGLYAYESIKYNLKGKLFDDTVSDEEFRKEAKKVFERLKRNKNLD